MAEERPQTWEVASREATDWLILLQEEPEDRGLRGRFERWRQAHPLNAAAWNSTARAAGLIEDAPPTFDRAWRPFVQGVRRQRTSGHPADPALPSRHSRRRGLQVAALAVAACLALLVVPNLVLQMRADFTTDTAELRQVTLEDGSTVTLGPESAIAVSYAEGERRVDLLSGEAFFDVVENPDRPFSVATRDVRTTVLGTRFDLRIDGEGAAVAVEEGTVRVDRPDATPPVAEVLEVGQSVRVRWRGQLRRGEVQPSQVAAWRRQRLIAQDEPVEAVIDRLRPYYGGTILVADSSLTGRTVTGVYNLDDPVDAVRGIAQAHDASVRQVTPWLLIVSGH